MFDIEKFDISKANNYRYTLIKHKMCFDFIVRDGKAYFMQDAEIYKVFDPRLNYSSLIRCKCDLDDDSFTHFIMRTKPYPDILNYTNDMVHKTIIIQDFTKELNLTTTFKPFPEYHNLQNLYVLGENSGLDLTLFD